MIHCLICIVICFGFEILSRIDPFPTTSGSAHKIKGVLWLYIWSPPFDHWCASALKYYHALIHFPLCLEEVLTKLKGFSIIYVTIFNVLRLWYIFMHWSFSHYIWKCSWFVGTYKGCDELCFDIQCAEKATKYIHALIVQPIHLEVLANYFGTYKRWDDLHFDIHCAETLIYIHALILQLLHLEVLTIYFGTYEWWDDLHFDIHCAETLIYIWLWNMLRWMIVKVECNYYCTIFIGGVSN